MLARCYCPLRLFLPALQPLPSGRCGALEGTFLLGLRSGSRACCLPTSESLPVWPGPAFACPIRRDGFSSAFSRRSLSSVCSRGGGPREHISRNGVESRGQSSAAYVLGRVSEKFWRWQR